MKPIAKIITVSLMLLSNVNHAFAIGAGKFSSASTVRRELKMEKEQKEKLKLIKNTYDDVKDVAIETWADGKTYYVIYSIYKEYTLMPVDSEQPYFANGTWIHFQPYLELTERKGQQFFKIDEKTWATYTGTTTFDPSTEIRTFGDREYVFIPQGPNYPGYVYTLEGERLLMSENIEFRLAEQAGYTTDATTGLSFYHPELSPRFLGVENTPEYAKYGKVTQFNLDFFQKKNSKAHIAVPGNVYFVYSEFPKSSVIKTEVREDVNGVLHEYKVFEAEGQFPLSNDLTLLLHAGTSPKSILPGAAYKVKLSMPDQIAYYTYNDRENGFDRMGAVSLVDSTFTVPARFADVKVFYDSEHKPFTMVRLSRLGKYELYDPAKSYDYSEMSELELSFEKKIWWKVLELTKVKKLEDVRPENLYPWICAEIEGLKNLIEGQEYYLADWRAMNLSGSQESDLMNRRDKRWMYPIDFGTEFKVEDAIAHAALSLPSVKQEQLNTMAAYLTHLRERKSDLDNQIYWAEEDYRTNKKRMLAAERDERQRVVYEAMQEQQATEAAQQAAVASFIGQFFGMLTGNYVSNPTPAPAAGVMAAPTYISTSGQVPAVGPYVIGERMIDKTHGSPELEGAAIVAGWQPESPSYEASSSHTHKSGGNLCRGCFGSGKCPHCNGKGRYMPNLDGKYIDCTSCGQTGVCPRCNGQKHH